MALSGPPCSQRRQPAVTVVIDKPIPPHIVSCKRCSVLSLLSKTNRKPAGPASSRTWESAALQSRLRAQVCYRGCLFTWLGSHFGAELGKPVSERRALGVASSSGAPYRARNVALANKPTGREPGSAKDTLLRSHPGSGLPEDRPRCGIEIAGSEWRKAGKAPAHLKSIWVSSRMSLRTRSLAESAWDFRRCSRSASPDCPDSIINAAKRSAARVLAGLAWTSRLARAVVLADCPGVPRAMTGGRGNLAPPPLRRKDGLRPSRNGRGSSRPGQGPGLPARPPDHRARDPGSDRATPPSRQSGPRAGHFLPGPARLGRPPGRLSSRALPHASMGIGEWSRSQSSRSTPAGSAQRYHVRRRSRRTSSNRPSKR